MTKATSSYLTQERRSYEEAARVIAEKRAAEKRFAADREARIDRLAA